MCLTFIAPHPPRRRRQRHLMQARLSRVRPCLAAPRPHHRSPQARLKRHPRYLPQLHHHVLVARPEDCQYTAIWHNLLLYQRLPKAQYRARLLQLMSRLPPRHHQSNLQCQQSQKRCQLSLQLRRSRGSQPARHLPSPRLAHHPPSRPHQSRHLSSLNHR